MTSFLEYDTLFSNFKEDLSTMVPKIIEDCVWKPQNVSAREEWQLKIVELIAQHFSILGDLQNLFDWFDLDKKMFDESCFKTVSSFSKYLDLFRDRDGGMKILEKIIEGLEDIDMEQSNVVVVGG